LENHLDIHRHARAHPTRLAEDLAHGVRENRIAGARGVWCRVLDWVCACNLERWHMWLILFGVIVLIAGGVVVYMLRNIGKIE
jgi:hypothetical protein